MEYSYPTVQFIPFQHFSDGPTRRYMMDDTCDVVRGLEACYEEPFIIIGLKDPLLYQHEVTDS